MSSRRVACPKCRSRATRTMETRAEGDSSTLRRKLCQRCGHRFISREQVVEGYVVA